MDITTIDFLTALNNPEDTVNIRIVSDKKGDKFTGVKIACECGKFKSIEENLNKHNAQNRGIFAVINSGGNTDASITRINAQFTEMDEGTFEEQKKKIEAFPIPPSMVVKTQKSLHVYWLVDKDSKVERFRSIQKGLVKYFNGDPACVNESRPMRLPGFNHCKKEEPVEVKCISYHPERRYTQDQLADVLPEVETSPVDRKSGEEKGMDLVMNGCDFMQFCKDNAETLPEPLWYAMVTNLAVFEDGTDMIHTLSVPYPGYSESETQKKINHFLESGTNPMTCKMICEKGFACPKYSSGECKVRSPAALSYQPADIATLDARLRALPITGDMVKDIQTATAFVNTYSPAEVTVIPTATKTYTDENGDPIEDWNGAEFEFRMYASMGYYMNGVTTEITEVPMPEGSVISTSGSTTEYYKSAAIDSTNADKAGEALGEITYSVPGVYLYSIYERTPSDPIVGVTYSSALYYMTVLVTDDGSGTLSTTVSYEQYTNDSGTVVEDYFASSINITNIYDIDTAEAVFLATKNLTDHSVLSNDGVMSDGEFTFGVEALGGYPTVGGSRNNYTVDAAYVPLADSAENGIMTMTNSSSGTVGFENISYTKESQGTTYVYK